MNIRYIYVEDNGAIAYYDFNDATCSSRQYIADTYGKMSFNIEYYKELEQIDGTNDYISRWLSKVTISGLDGKDPLGFPVFFVAKEGALPGEQDYLNASVSKDTNLFKISH